MKIALIGAGNVATQLGIALKKARHQIIFVYSRSTSSAQELGTVLKSPFGMNIKDIPSKADLYIVSISDHAIKDFLSKFPHKNKAIVHTSGSVSINVFGKNYKNCGVIYPIQTFSKRRNLDFKSIPLMIEGINNRTMDIVKKIASSISEVVYPMDSEKRKTVHLAAVIANNFTNHLLFHAEKILKRKKIPLFILLTLLGETLAKAIIFSPSAAQTGPAKRGDTKIIEEHLKMLKDEPRLKEIYELLTKSIEETSGTRL